MPLSEEQRNLVAAFRTWLVDTLAGDEQLGPHHTNDRQDESTLEDRFSAGESVWLEVALRPLLPQIRVGLLTDDRWKSEELEQKIQDSGDTMEEFVGVAFEEHHLDWDEPPVEHYRAAGKYFYFATPLDLDSLDRLADPQIRTKTIKMLHAYRTAFT